MAPIVAPDPDTRLADSNAGKALTTAAAALTISAAAVDRQAAAVRSAAKSETVEKQLQSLAVVKQALEHQATIALSNAELHAEIQTAADVFKRDAPSKLEVGIAWAAWQDARETQRAAAGGPGAAQARGATQAAMDTYNLLVEKRAKAIEAFHSAEQVALRKHQERLRSLGAGQEVDSSHRGLGKPPGPAPGPGKPPGPARDAMLLYGRDGSAPGKPAAPAPSTSPSSGSTPAQAAEIANLLAGQQAKGQQPAQIPQSQLQPAPQAPAPTVAPAAASAAKPANDKGRVVDNSLLDEILNSGAPVAATVAATVPATVTAHAPATPAVPTAPTPSTSGSSTPNLTTEADVSGRSDGPRTALSSAATENAKAAPASTSGTGTTPGQGVGQPMMPMGATGGGGGALAAKDKSPIKVYGADAAEMHGHTTVGEAVKGGTIAQRRDGGSAAA